MVSMAHGPKFTLKDMASSPMHSAAMLTVT